MRLTGLGGNDILPSFSARRPRLRPIVLLAFDKVLLLDITGPLQTFATANELAVEAGLPTPYCVSVVSLRGGAVATSSGLRLLSDPAASLRGKAIDTLLVPGGRGARQDPPQPGLVPWIAARARRARRVCSVCTGAFLLAEAGLLDGRRAVTHWAHCAALQRQFPRVTVEPDPIFLRDGAIWTSAGVTAGIDLALALVEEDLGRDLALRVARQLVVFLKRPGGQSQFSAVLQSQSGEDGRFARLHDWTAEHLADDLRVETLAERAGMSPRNFARLYAKRLGTTPAKAVERLRLEAARRALEDGTAPVERVARACGFGDEERMRRAFLRCLGVPPSQYRQRFSRGEAA